MGDDVAGRTRARRPGPVIRPAVACLAVALALSCSILKRENGPPPAVLSKAPGAEPIGSMACNDCHDDVVASVGSTSHGIFPLDGEPGRRYCEACHGPGGNHYESYDPADIFGKEDLAHLDNPQRNAACLSCHRTMATRWLTRSPHEGRDLSCWNCHPDALHAKTDPKGPVVTPAVVGGAQDRGEFCFQCHEDVRQEFTLEVQHPVVTGKMGCTSCHGPHGEEGKVEASMDVSEVCTSCHAQMAGPWIYEHDAMSDGCTSCHLPHGATNPKMLVMTGNALCLQCHIDVNFPDVNGQDHSVYIGSGASCLECHFEVHGSNASHILAPGI